MRVLILLAALLAPVTAAAERVEVLVEDQVMYEFGAALPPEASLRVTYAPEMGEAVMLKTFWLDRATGQFVADVLDAGGEIRRVAGMAVATLRAPVPVRQLMPGEIVTEADIAMVDFPVNRINNFAITDAGMLVGMEVRRLLNQGRLVMTQSVIPPRVIERGERVKITFSDAGLSLSASGRALSDAAAGEPVKVVNLASNRSIVGIAKADGIVEISQ